MAITSKNADGAILARIPTMVQDLRDAFRTGRTRPLSWRLEQLRRMRAMLCDHEKAFWEALRADLGKPEIEAWAGETGYMLNEIQYTLKNLPRWMKPEKVATPMSVKPAKATVVREPFGVALIIGPWNYPSQLILGPLIGAVAAGNCAVLKPSEVSAQTARLVANLIPQYLDASCIRVVEGAIPETTALLKEKFDYIFYTGNGTVARIVMAAAANHLTPLSLELGGKCPCIVDENVDLDVAARRIVWGKYFNSGQTCVAPDYILAHQAVQGPLLEAMKRAVHEFYGADPKKSPDYGRIVNERHHKRLCALLEGQKIVVGGEADEAGRYLAPTILAEVSPDSKVMEDEIFGPILPVLEVPSIRHAIEFITDRPKPLALYVFSSDRSVQEKVLGETSSGGAAVNDCMMHLAVPELPFGGVGESGFGAYHGRAGFETFSHRRSILNKATFVDPNLRYPPYTESKKKWMKRLM